MNRGEFIDYLLEKGKCNRFNEHQIDALEQFCFALYENTELDKPAARIAELEKARTKLLSCLLSISDEVLGEITMNRRVDANYIESRINATTGMTNPQLWEALKEQE